MDYAGNGLVPFNRNQIAVAFRQLPLDDLMAGGIVAERLAQYALEDEPDDPAPELLDDDQEIEEPDYSIHNGSGVYLGSVRNNAFGVIEALDADDVSLGLFSCKDDADDAIFDRWYAKAAGNGGDPAALEPDQFDWATCAEAVATDIFGTPNESRSRGDVRFIGGNGVVSIDFATGLWCELAANGRAGGVAKLISVYKGIADPAEAIAYAKECRQAFENGGDDPATMSHEEAAAGGVFDCSEEDDTAAGPMLAAALGYAARGWEVFPAKIVGKTKKSYKSEKYSGGAKWGKTRDPEQIRRDFHRWPKANIGIPTGAANGFFVAETDTKKGHDVDGDASLAKLEQKYGKLPDTLMAESPSGSKHRYFKHPSNGIKIMTSASMLGPGIDVRGDGGMVIAPPSVRGDGVYHWLNDNAIAEAPQWLIDLVAGGKKPSLEHLDPNQGFAEGVEPPPPTPLPLEPILEGCAWLRHVHSTGGADQSESLWKLALNACVFLKEHEGLIHKLSDKHPGYEYDKTETKWEHALRDKEANDLGWPQCKTIHDNGSVHCKTCPHLKLGKSPLNLGLAAAHDDRVDEELQALGGTRPLEARLPEGFCLDEKGQLCAFIPARIDGKKHHPARLLQLLMTEIKDPSLQFQNGYFGVGFVAATDKNGVQQVFLNSANVYAPGLFTELAKRCVLFCPDKPAKEQLERFTVAWLKKLLGEGAAIRDSGTMGWRHEGGNIMGFVYGDELHHENGTGIRIIARADDEFRKWYTPVGKRETWVKAAKLLTDRKRPELDCLIAVAFAAPLMVFTGTTYGAILSVWGEPGTAKSTAQQVAAAVWGHPKQTRESLNSTPKSVQGRLGRTRNLPAHWDDVQDERHQLALFDCMFVVAEGTEGGRLNPDATYKPRLDWQTMMVACSNASFVEFLIKKQKSTTAGMRRVFEFKYNKEGDEPGMINALDASNIFAELEHNYGGIGLEYAQMLAHEHKEIKILVSDMINKFTKEVAGTGDESFWLGICGVLLAGATLANRLGGELDVKAMWKFLVEAYHRNRTIRGTEGTEGGSFENTEQALVAFLNFYVGGGNTLYTDKLFVHKETPVQMMRGPEKGHPLCVQIARDRCLIVISKRAMREYFEKHDIQARQVFDGLVEYFNAKQTRHTLGAGTEYAQAREWCFEIPDCDKQSVLQDLLHARGEPVPQPKA